MRCFILETFSVCLAANLACVKRGKTTALKIGQQRQGIATMPTMRSTGGFFLVGGVDGACQSGGGIDMATV